jgi:muconate cycloisomerase
VLETLVAPELLGEDPRQVTRLRSKIDRAVRNNPFTKAAVDMALWDLAAKAAEVPLNQFLGGKVRDEIPIKLVIGAFDVPRAVALAEQFLEWGASCLKVKVGLNPTEDLDRVASIRKVAGSDVRIGIDANGGWSLPRAYRMLPELEEYDLFFAEEPTTPADAAAWADLRRSTSIPLMADESVFTLNDAWRLAVGQAVDVFSIYPGKHGGIAETLAIAHIAQTAGIVCSVGGNLELGIATAAMLQLAAALPSINCEDFPCDILGPLHHVTDLLTEPLTIGPEKARLPEGPGLGVELDENQLNHYRLNG